MVGLVIVSHSARLAEGVAELARGMAGPEVRLAATGGLDLPGRPLGTDAAQVQRAIEAVYSEDGVLVLMDLGSAVLSAEMALEMLPPEWRAHVQLCEAPLVEGALAAAVQARLGGSLEQVAAEARGALSAKQAHLGLPPVPTASVASLETTAPSESLRLTIHNRLGLHARPAAQLVQTAAQFAHTDVRVSNESTGRGPVSAKSINAVATLGVRRGQIILLTAAGPEAAPALAALQRLVTDNFGEVDEAPPVAVVTSAPLAAPLAAQTLRGIPASPGLALGPARLFRPALPDVPTHTISDPAAEWQRLLAALDKTRAQLRSLHSAVARRADAYAAAIFDAHLLFLDDEALRGPAHAAIYGEHLNAAAAWRRAVELVAADYAALDDDYLRARAADVLDVGQQVLLQLLGGAAPAVLTAPGLLIAADLTPADTARLDPALVMGLATALGGPTSHSAILARALGLPAVVGLGEGVLALAEGTPLIVDGDAGLVIPSPDEETAAEYARRQHAAQTAAAEARAASAAPAFTRDGRHVEVAANIGSVADARAAVAAGAEGVGLFRTEFLFLERRDAPTEDEQYAAYRAAAAVMGRERPLIIRTLDVGGDKPLPYIDMGVEANPFLGWRAVRLCLARPEFFKIQLRAIARVAAEFPLVKVMFPMIATLDEFRAARALLWEAAAEVQTSTPIAAGIMVEIPSAALRAAAFAAEVDFFSIGTNDLTQYTLAAERGNARVAALADAFQPAVLDLIQRVVAAAHARGKWVGVCGEMAGDPQAVRLLVGLGVDELSMSAPAIPRAKQLIRAADSAVWQARAAAALMQETPAAVRAALAA